MFVTHLGGQGWPEHLLLNHELVRGHCALCKGPGWPSKTQVTTSCVTWEIRTLIKIFDQLNIGRYVRQEVYSLNYNINNLVLFCQDLSLFSLLESYDFINKITNHYAFIKIKI